MQLISVASTKSTSSGLYFVAKMDIFFFQLGVLKMFFKYMTLFNEYFKFKLSKTDFFRVFFFNRKLASGPRK